MIKLCQLNKVVLCIVFAQKAKNPLFQVFFHSMQKLSQQTIKIDPNFIPMFCQQKVESVFQTMNS